MRTITRYRLHVVGLMLLLATGCQTTYPTAIMRLPAAHTSARIQDMTLLENTRSMDAAEITNRGVDLFVLQRYSEAEYYLSEATRRFPTYQPAFCYLGACQAQLGRREEARRSLRIAIRLSPFTQEASHAEQWLQSISR